MNAILLAAGFGSRLLPLTETTPKCMVKIGNKPIILHIMNIYRNFGYNDFIIASGSGASQERVLNVTSEGVVQFFAQDNSYTPTAVLGGIYFTSASAFIGVE